LVILVSCFSCIVLWCTEQEKQEMLLVAGDHWQVQTSECRFSSFIILHCSFSVTDSCSKVIHSFNLKCALYTANNVWPVLFYYSDKQCKQHFICNVLQGITKAQVLNTCPVNIVYDITM